MQANSMLGIRSLGRGSPLLVCLALLLLALQPPAAAAVGDAERGAKILRERQCTTCHPVAGVGGTAAPDLGRRSSRDFGPATLAAMFWNHGPRMWQAMAQLQIEVPRLTQEEVGHIYAYFYSLRYFDPPGDAARGKKVFQAKSCAHCHSLTPAEPSKGPPVSAWPALSDPVSWVQQMWNHSGEMARQMAGEGLAWPQFSVQEMVDLKVYLEHLPGLTLQTPRFHMGEAAAGKGVLEDHGCGACHTVGEPLAGKVDLLTIARGERSITGLAVEMWNHRPLMAAAAPGQRLEVKPFEGHQMADLLAYLFEKGYFRTWGRAHRGERLFRDKGCASCHGQPGSTAPNLRTRDPELTAIDIAGGVWRHGPEMLAQMKQRGLDWPALTDEDVADLVAFFNAK